MITAGTVAALRVLTHGLGKIMKVRLCRSSEVEAEQDAWRIAHFSGNSLHLRC